MTALVNKVKLKTQKNGQNWKQKQCVTSKLDKQNEIPNKFNMTV